MQLVDYCIISHSRFTVHQSCDNSGGTNSTRVIINLSIWPLSCKNSSTLIGHARHSGDTNSIYHKLPRNKLSQLAGNRGHCRYTRCIKDSWLVNLFLCFIYSPTNRFCFFIRSFAKECQVVRWMDRQSDRKIKRCTRVFLLKNIFFSIDFGLIPNFI